MYHGATIPDPTTVEPLKLVRLFSKRLITSQPVVAELPSSQVETEIIPEKERAEAAMRNEKIANARSIAIAAVQQQRQQKPVTASPIIQNALLEWLEAKLLKNEIECTELRKLAEARKRGIPVSLASLHLGFEEEKDSSLGDAYLLKKLEAVVLLKEEECTKARRLLVEAMKRGTSQSRKDALCVSLSTQLSSPKSVLQARPSQCSEAAVVPKPENRLHGEQLALENGGHIETLNLSFERPATYRRRFLKLCSARGCSRKYKLKKYCCYIDSEEVYDYPSRELQYI
jgi:hypothetical protein